MWSSRAKLHLAETNQEKQHTARQLPSANLGLRAGGRLPDQKVSV